MHNLTKGNQQALALSLLFFISALCFVPYHEMWRDELQAWLLARDSQSVFELFKNLKYEYHQGLWYLLLFPLTRIFTYPEAMQYLNVSIATAAIYILARYSPFSLLQKMLLAFSYFLFFEYALIARNYALTVFFIFLICTLFSKRTKYPLAFSSSIFFLCHTSVLGLIFAICISLTVLLEAQILRIKERAAQEKAAQERHMQERDAHGFHWQVALAGLIVITGIGSAIFQLSPPADLAVGPWKWYPSLAGLKNILIVTIGAYFPLPKFELHFWRTLFGLSNEFITIFSVFWVLFFVLLFVRFLSSRPAALFLFVSTSAALILLFYAKHLGELRHHGFLFIALLSALWIYPDCAPCEKLWWGKYFKSVSEKLASRALLALLTIQFISSSIAIFIDYRYVFSSAKETAQFLCSSDLTSAQMIGDVSYSASAVAAYLNNKPFFYPDAQRYGTFIKWDNQRTKEVNLSTLLSDSRRLSLQGHPVVLILNQSLDDYKIGPDVNASQIHFKKMFESSPIILWDERFYVYLFLPTIAAQK
jgi:hypothetical protein